MLSGPPIEISVKVEDSTRSLQPPIFSYSQGSSHIDSWAFLEFPACAKGAECKCTSNLERWKAGLRIMSADPSSHFAPAGGGSVISWIEFPLLSTGWVNWWVSFVLSWDDDGEGANSIWSNLDHRETMEKGQTRSEVISNLDHWRFAITYKEN